MRFFCDCFQRSIWRDEVTYTSYFSFFTFSRVRHTFIGLLNFLSFRFIVSVLSFNLSSLIVTLGSTINWFEPIFFTTLNRLLCWCTIEMNHWSFRIEPRLTKYFRVVLLSRLTEFLLYDLFDRDGLLGLSLIFRRICVILLGKFFLFVSTQPHFGDFIDRTMKSLILLGCWRIFIGWDCIV